MTRTYVVKDEAGLHARPASLLVQSAAKYPNDITITYNDKTITMKSIMAVMSLGIPHGASFTITVQEDSGSILQELESILNEHSVI